MNTKKREIDGITNRYANDFEIKEDEVIIKDGGAKQKARVVANKLHEKGYTTFVNPLDDGYEVKVKG